MLGLVRQTALRVRSIAQYGRVTVQVLANRYSSNTSQGSRFPYSDLNDSLEPDIKQRLAEEEKNAGFLPNIFRAMAHRPQEFRAFLAYYDALMNKETGSLTMAEKEMIIVATSSHNKCHYCVVSRSALLRIFSADQYKADLIAIDPECAQLTERERAIIKFAMKVCKSEMILDEDITELEQYGLSRDDIWDVGAIAAFFALSNRMAQLTAIRPNKEFYLMGRVNPDQEK